MTQHEAFVKAVRDAPDDDTPRLVYADWLDERGEGERAEFIRVQCELARRQPADPRYPELHLRQLELLAEHEHEWLGEWAGRLVRWEFHRGLLDAVTITPEPFVRDGLDLFARHPVRRVAPVDEEGESLAVAAVRRFVAAPAVRYVRALEVSGCRPGEPLWAMYGGEVATGAWLTALAKATHVRRLEELSFAGGTRSGRGLVPRKAWRAFCAAPHLRTLCRLDLSDAYRNDEPQAFPDLVADLGRARFARRLRSLSFSGCYFGDEAAYRLADEKALAGLEELDLSGCNLLRTEGLRAILEAPVSRNLTSLGVPYGPDLRVAALSPSLSRLRRLRLAGSVVSSSVVVMGDRARPLGRTVGREEWEPLFRSPHWGGLTRLSLDAYTDIPPEAIASLLGAPWVANLRELRLSYTNADAASFEPLLGRAADGPTALHVLAVPPAEGLGRLLARWPGLEGLTALDFSTLMGEAGDSTALLRSPHLSRRLARLDLTQSCRPPQAVTLLARCAALAGLRWLGFGYNELAPKKMTALLRSPHLRHLESLHLGSEYGDGAEEALALLATSDALPRLRDVVVGSATAAPAVEALRRRFGPRLRVWADC